MSRTIPVAAARPLRRGVSIATTSDDEVVGTVLDLHACARSKSTLFDVERYLVTEHHGPITHQRGAPVPS